ncbi:L-asparaginase [Flavobacterium anhuiense]|jgi:L-asparaginase|uniref:L-asparaginase n=1 Tax=Flavobacterium anhuiense TaxID=459526 RepID=A0AAC9D3K7_9FLAO|nr:type II asparaginase [Flavobacterium anhuiense]AOC97094.1 L-asparaginase [Flavobacterium anhuiense]URM35616.1 type II asparaginase [Flavobacterium anhuiense]SCY47622.1 L-asparaginase [Flavobacterium anhuiense]
MKNLFTLLLSVLLVTGIYAQKLPRIKILATGGTIAGQGASADRSAYTAGQLPIKDLIAAVPGIDKVAEISGEQISNVGSQDMTVDIWIKLNKRINEIYKNNEADGIVITHGTDTQEETAYFLSLTVRYDKPVIITGSMRPATAISADGPKNLYDAVTLAASKQAAHSGVLLVFNEYIFTGRSAVKTSTTHLNAFTAPNNGPIGQVYDGKVILYETPVRKANKNTPFDITGLTTLPEVAIVELYADAPATAINAYVASGVKGIVTGGLGNGNLNKVNSDAAASAVKKGIAVARASRVPSGRVTLFDETDDQKLGTIVTDDLIPQKARILLMLGLTQTSDSKKLQEYFFEY